MRRSGHKEESGAPGDIHTGAWDDINSAFGRFAGAFISLASVDYKRQNHHYIRWQVLIDKVSRMLRQ